MPFDFATALTPVADNDQQVDNTPVNDTQTQQPQTDEQLVDKAITQSQNPNTVQSAAPDTPPENSQIDYNSFLDKMSDGLIKDEDGFKALLPKVKDYDTIKKQNEELAAKMAQAPVFANALVKGFNDLVAAGASKEQLNTFWKLNNDYGSISEMSDREARVAKLIIVDGVKPSVAEKKVDLEFKIGHEDVDEDEREILDDDLRVAALKDKSELEKFKAAVSDVKQVPREELALQQQAAFQAHQQAVKPYVQEVVKSVPNLGIFKLGGTGDVPAFDFEIPISDEARATIGNNVESYFMDGLTPVTPDNTRLALQYARAEYFREHAEELFSNVYNKAFNKAYETAVNKYENRSGLQPQKDRPNVGGTNDAGQIAQFMQNVANRTV